MIAADVPEVDALENKGATASRAELGVSPVAQLRLQQAGIVEQWAALVGPQIAAVTAPESVTPDGVLRVHVATAAWANELSLMTPRILARLNASSFEIGQPFLAISTAV